MKDKVQNLVKGVTDGLKQVFLGTTSDSAEVTAPTNGHLATLITAVMYIDVS